MESSFVEFNAVAGVPTVVRIASIGGNRVLLSGFAIDSVNPRTKALKPLPVDLERHAIGDAGKKEKRLNPDDATDGGLDSDGDGYANLENYLHSLTEGHSAAS